MLQIRLPIYSRRDCITLKPRPAALASPSDQHTGAQRQAGRTRASGPTLPGGARAPVSETLCVEAFDLTPATESAVRT
jgi:hypothetical protein